MFESPATCPPQAKLSLQQSSETRVPQRISDTSVFRRWRCSACAARCTERNESLVFPRYKKCGTLSLTGGIPKQGRRLQPQTVAEPVLRPKRQNHVATMTFEQSRAERPIQNRSRWGQDPEEKRTKLRCPANLKLDK